MHPLSLRLIAITPPPVRPGVRTAVETVESAIEDRLPGLAAEIAFWVLLSLPALLLALVAGFGFLGDRLGDDWETQLVERVVEAAGFALSETAIENAVVPLVSQLLTGGTVTVISLAFVAALWTASRAVKVVLQTLARVANGEEVRQGWQDRALGFAIALAAIGVGIVLAPLLLAGPNFGDQIAGWLGLEFDLVGALWRRLYWPVVVVAATLAVWMLYHLGIPVRRRWRDELPGAMLATATWLAGSGGIRLYGSWFLTTDSVYGSLAGPLVALLWLWLSGFAVLLGAELNAVLRRAT